jgi:hypothetical protein
VTDHLLPLASAGAGSLASAPPSQLDIALHHGSASRFSSLHPPFFAFHRTPLETAEAIA